MANKHKFMIKLHEFCKIYSELGNNNTHFIIGIFLFQMATFSKFSFQDKNFCRICTFMMVSLLEISAFDRFQLNCKI